jgi:glucosamine-6-phosphate deaminase
VPDGAHGDPDESARRYEAELAGSGGIGLQLLGIGRNGHIGFNEPGSPFDSRTRVVELTDDTREANRRFFASLDEVPRRSITQGLGTILDARRIILVAQGAGKARAVERMVNGQITPGLPASILQRHPDALVVVTEDAASELSARIHT